MVAPLGVNSASREASAKRRERAAPSLQFETEARRASASASVCILPKPAPAGELEGWLTGEDIFAAEVVAAQSHARPFQRAVEASSPWGWLASAQLISRKATACPVSHSLNSLHGSSSF